MSDNGSDDQQQMMVNPSPPMDSQESSSNGSSGHQSPEQDESPTISKSNEKSSDEDPGLAKLQASDFLRMNTEQNRLAKEKQEQQDQAEEDAIFEAERKLALL
jgi:hypothetical protein